MEQKDEPLFLTPAEVGELTGIRAGRHGKTREQMQVECLRTMGIPFHVNARGRPIIARAFFTGAKTEPPPRPKWQPKAMMNIK
jgi:hypothetical protein